MRSNTAAPHMRSVALHARSPQPTQTAPAPRTIQPTQTTQTTSSGRVPPLTLVLSFDEYYRSDYRKLVGLAYVLTGSQFASEDLAQEALTEAHRKWTKISQYEDPAGWVRRVMINKSTSRGRRLRTEAKGLVRIAARRTESVAPSEPTLEVWAAVRELPPRQAQVIALFYWEDRSIPEIAELLEVSAETVKTHLKRARAALSVQLDSYRDGSG